MIAKVKEFSSLNAFLVVLKLHNERLNIFALSLPLRDSLLGVRVKVLLLLIQKSLSLESIGLFILELLDSNFVLDISLRLLEVLEFLKSLTLFLFFLLFSKLEFFISGSPERGEVVIFLSLSLLHSLLSLDLELTATFDSCLHLQLSLFLGFI